MVKSKSREEKIKTYLVDMMSPNFEIRSDAIYQLGRLNAKEAINPLIQIADDRNDPVFSDILLSLGRLKAQEARELFERELIDNPDIENREIAAWSLMNIKAIESIPLLLKAAKDERNLRYEFNFAMHLAYLEGKEDKGVKLLRRILEREGRIQERYVLEFNELLKELNINKQIEVVKDEINESKAIIINQPQSEERQEYLERIQSLEVKMEKLFGSIEDGSKERDALRDEFLGTRKSIEETFQKRDYFEVKGQRENLQTQIDFIKGEVAYVKQRADEKITIKDEFAGAWKVVSLLGLILGGISIIISIVLTILKIIDII